MNKFNKLIISILMLVLISNFVSAYADITFKFDQDDVGTLVYDCLDSSCASVTDFSGTYESQTNDGELRVLFPSTLKHEGYAVYFYSENFIPKAYKSTFNTGGNADVHTSDIDIPSFNKIENCQAVVDKPIILNSVYANEPLQINTKASLAATTTSAFKRVHNDVEYIPEQLKNEFYSSEVKVTLEIFAESNELVKKEVKNLNLYLGEQEELNFEWTPSVKGDYSARITSKVVDSQCSSDVEAYARADFSVLQGRPTDEYYTIINNFDINNEFPKENDELSFSFSKISNYADSAHRLFAVPTIVNYQVYDENQNLIYNQQITLPANDNTVDSETYSFSWMPAVKGKYSVVIDAYAKETKGNRDNLAERMILGFYVGEEPNYDINFQIRDDSNGNPIPGVIVKMNGLMGITDSEGLLSFTELSVGVYNYIAEHSTYDSFDGSIDLVDVSMNVFFFMSHSDPTDTISTITFTNSPPTTAYVRVPYEFNLNAVSDLGNDVIFQVIKGPDNFKINNAGQITWLPLPQQLGKNTIIVLATDGSSTEELVWDVNVLVAPEVNEQSDALGIMAIRFPLGDQTSPGRTISVSLVMKSNADLDDSVMTVSIPELGIFNRVRFDLDKNDVTYEAVYLDIPTYANTGTYLVRISVGNEDLKRIKHRTLTVI